jgi:hypothetical protein
MTKGMPGENPIDSTDEPQETDTTPRTDADAAALLEGLITSAEPGLTDEELARLDAVIAYLRGTDTTPITPSPSPYPTGSVAGRAHGAASQAALASERTADDRLAGALARHSHSLQAIARELGGDQT